MGATRVDGRVNGEVNGGVDGRGIEWPMPRKDSQFDKGNPGGKIAWDRMKGELARVRGECSAAQAQCSILLDRVADLERQLAAARERSDEGRGGDDPSRGRITSGLMRKVADQDPAKDSGHLEATLRVRFAKDCFEYDREMKAREAEERAAAVEASGVLEPDEAEKLVEAEIEKLLAEMREKPWLKQV